MAVSKGYSPDVFLFLLITLLIVCFAEKAPDFTTHFPFSLEFSNSTGGRLPCKANGEPKPRLSWILSDGSPINSVPELRHVTSDGTLVFSPFKAEDYRPDVHSVVYFCTASNSIGTLASTPVQVKGVVIQPFDVYVYDVYSIKGNLAIMRCHIPEFLTEYVMTISWIRDSAITISTGIFNATSKYVLLSNGDLLIRDVDESDGMSTFRCQATHRLTGDTKTSLTHGRLIVTESEGSVPPKIIERKGLHIAKEGDQFLISCVATGYPVPVYRWNKQTTRGTLEEIATNKRSKVMPGLLLISNVNSFDSGIYICTASNSLGSDKVAMELHVYKTLSATLNPETNKIDAGLSFSLNCVTSGSPILSINWLKDGKPLSGKLFVESDNKTITISKMTSSHSGIYQCFVSNSKEITSGVSVVQLGDSIPELLTTFEEQQLQRGQKSVLQCVANGIPFPVITWTLDNSEIQSNDRIEIEVIKENSHRVMSRLRLINVKPEDGGLYRCIAENKAGKTQHQARIFVYGPINVRSGVKLLAVSGAEIQIDCPVYGYPYRSISWEKNEIPLPDNMFQQVHKNGTLILTKMNPRRDNGHYKCIVKGNNNEQVKGTVEVVVMVPPKITPFSFQEEQIREGTRARIQCVVNEGETPLKLTWLKDGLPLFSDLDVTIRDLDEFSSILMISAITPRHNGNYTCVASNAAGEAHHTAHLFVNVPPKILPFAFQDDQFFKGMRAYIVCAVSQGDLPIEFTWFKDLRPIPPSLGVVTRNIDSHANSLSIESVSSAHTGNFTCTAGNKAGIVSHTAQLLVYVIPRIIPFAFRSDMYEGSSARITCVIDQGDLPLTIKWLKDNQPLFGREGVTTRTIDEYSSILTIENLHQEHAGNYTCVARNAAATVTHTTSLTVQVPPKVVPFTFQDDHLLEGMLVRVSCVVSRGDLPLTIQWLKDGVPIPDHLSVTIRDFDEYSSVLSIDPVSAKHSGNYTCSAKNQAGSSAFSANLIVKVPPRWLIKPDNVILKTGKTLILNCQAAGYPLPTITWKKVTGINIEAESRRLENNEYISILPNNSLFFSQISKSDEGLYLCLASNNVGEPLSKVVSLKVKAAPEFEKDYFEIKVKKGEEVKIPCYADGDWPVTYRWNVNNRNIDENHRYKIEMKNENIKNISLLVIPWVDKKDSTVFSCEAENEMGKSEVRIKLTVQEIPEAPEIIFPISVVNQTVKVSWTVPYDGNSPILRYYVQYKKQDVSWNDNIDSVIVPESRTTAFISGLQPATIYDFRVFAANILGNGSSSSDAASVKTEDSTPKGSPQDVQIESIDANTLRLTWTPPPKVSWNGAINGYSIGYKIKHTQDDYIYKELEVPEDYTDDLIFQLNNLQKFTEYSVIIAAFNSKGKGPNSDPVFAMTSEDVPTDHPHEVRCSSLSSKSIYVLWEFPTSRKANGILRGFKVLYKPADEWYDAFLQQKIVDSSRVTLQELEANTNYSIQVVAFTKVGDGKRSPPVFCKTHEDVPEAPEAVRVLPSSSDAVVVSWKPSSKKTGNIIKYNVFYTPIDGKREIEPETQMTEQILQDAILVSSDGSSQYLEVSRLKKNQKYAFWVTATSAIGDSPISSVVAQTVADTIIAAKSVTFDETIQIQWKETIVLPCRAVGVPPPQRKWLLGNQEIEENDRLSIRDDGSLLISKAGIEDGGNYTCTIYNEYGKDEVKYAVNVRVPPAAPILGVVSKSQSSINLQWKAGPDGGDRIKGYLLHYKKDHEQWVTKEIRAEHRFFTFDGLACGATYQIYMEAFNSIGPGAPCDIITVPMEGAHMEAPSKELLIREGPTFATVHLNVWPSSGCPVDHFGVEYKSLSSKEWTVVGNVISPSQKKLVVSGLTPASWYLLKLLVETSGGTSVFEYKFSTLTLAGATIAPDIYGDIKPMYIFYMDPLIFIPAVILLIVVIIASVIVCICMKQKNRKPKHHYEFSETGSKLNTWSRYSRTMSIGSYGRSARDSTLSSRRNNDPSPYATSRLADCYPEGVPSNSHGVPTAPPPVPAFRHDSLPVAYRHGISGETHESTFSSPSVFSTPQKDGRSNDGYDPPPKAHMIQDGRKSSSKELTH